MARKKVRRKRKHKPATARQIAAGRRNLAIARKSPKFKEAARRNLMKARASPKFKAAVLKNLIKARLALAKFRATHPPTAAQVAAAKANLIKARAALKAKRAAHPSQRTTSRSAGLIHRNRVLRHRETAAMRRLIRLQTAAFNRVQRQRSRIPTSFHRRRRRG